LFRQQSFTASLLRRNIYNRLLYNSFSPFFCLFRWFFSIFMSLLWQARFFTTVNHLRDLPNTQVPELAFAGRSNAGKSTAINILCNQKRLAFASKTPGRTQHINYFSIGGAHVGQHRKDETKVEEIRALLVDLPGYGYAEVPGEAKAHWTQLLGNYVQKRAQLAGLVLIMDARRPFTDLDIQMLEWFAPTGKPIHCLLTKSDKLNRNDSTNALRQARTVLKSYVDEQGQAFPFSVQLFSALKRVGLEEADAKIQSLLGLDQDLSAQLANGDAANSAPDHDTED
jgi:GTP-binding protein